MTSIHEGRVYLVATVVVLAIIIAVGIYWANLPRTAYAARISIPGSGIIQAPILLAEREGFFEASGLNVTFIQVQSGTAASQSMISGDVEFTNAISAAISAALRGADVKIVATYWATPHPDLVARPDVGVKTVSDLRDKTVGVSTSGSIDDYLLRVILEKNGLDPKKDVKISYVGARAESAALMMEKGDIDAAMLTPPVSLLYSDQKGYTLVAQSRDYISKYAAAGLVTTSKVIEEKPEVVKKMVVALAKTIEFIHQNRNATVQFFLESYPTLLDRPLAEKLYDTYRDFYDITLDQEAVKSTMSIEASSQGLTGYPPAETFIDESFV